MECPEQQYNDIADERRGRDETKKATNHSKESGNCPGETLIVNQLVND